MNNSPIGIFDSGVGGLSVFSELIKILPDENYIYFGDTKNLPYGTKTKEQLVSFCTDIFDFFKKQGVKAVVMACNTTSAVVYDTLKDKYDFRIFPVVQTVAKQIATGNYKNIGVFATNATINSHAYKTNLQKYNPNINVFEIACPEWVSIVEQAIENTPESIDNIKFHLDEMLKNNVDEIILGCTHYPYLLDVLAKFAPRDMFINPAKYFVRYIKEDLQKADLLNIKRDFHPQFIVSSNPNQFIKAAKLFYDVKEAKEIILTSNV